MAYNSNIPQQKYVASAGQTVFPFLFKIFQEADLTVYNVATGDDPELASPLTPNVDYTVIINGDSGGSITLTTGATDGALITIYRRLSITRYVEYQTSGDLLAATLNNDQDYQTYLVADLADSVLEELSGAGPGTPVSDAVRKTGDTMTGHLALPGGGTGTQALQSQEVDAKIAAVTTDTKLDTSGEAIVKSDDSFINNQCTAWVVFDGSTANPPVIAGYNVSTITRTSTGVYDITFSEAMDNANYCVTGNARGAAGVSYGGIIVPSEETTTQVTVTSFIELTTTSSGPKSNSIKVYIQIFGGKS